MQAGGDVVLYMISWSSQIWFLSLFRCFFPFSLFSIFVTGWSLICVLSLFLLLLSGHFFNSVRFSLWRRDRRGNGWTQSLYYIAELCLSYYSMDKHCCNNISSTFYYHFFVRVPIVYYNMWQGCGGE